MVKQPLRMDLLNRGNLAGIFGEGAYSAEPGFVSGSHRGTSTTPSSSPEGTKSTRAVPAQGRPPALLIPKSTQCGHNAQSWRTGRVPAFQRRADIVPDYPGTQAGAELLAEHRAASHSVGVGRVEGVEISPCDFALYDMVGFEQTQRVLAPEHRVGLSTTSFTRFRLRR